LHALFFFLRNTVQRIRSHTRAYMTLTYTRIHSPPWTYTRTSYPYEHLRKTEPAEILKLTKSPLTPSTTFSLFFTQTKYLVLI
jgi:hypothetical protein